MNVNTFHHDVLAELARSAESFLEIGVQDGDSSCAVAAANPRIAMTLCDTWGRQHGGTGRGSHEYVEQRLQAVHRGGRTYLDGRSSELLPQLGGQIFDLVHVDGDHSFEGAAADLRHVWCMVGRWLVVHDMFLQAVRDAVFTVLDEQRQGPVGGRGLPGMTGAAWLSLFDHGSFVLERRPA